MDEMLLELTAITVGALPGARAADDKLRERHAEN